VVELPHRARGVQQRRASRRWGQWGGGGSGHRGVARGGGDGHRGDGGIEGAAPTPFLAGMAENGGRGSRVVVGGGEPR
jgi:hypothetical protein